ncbi:thermonuclease family protein [Paenibacillus arenosi]|uniref:Thermonuclease family protein n=1 Tax=Paenibacillus arenosi TaxID=2774142 RepID=A0ABR9B0T1_9BACL|nr:thermonuclease family protein [Paenibacillus arenosi]MBD8500005.1 thermonuclease family protein [Paenibacillus arenosi]
MIKQPNNDSTVVSNPYITRLRNRKHLVLGLVILACTLLITQGCSTNAGTASDDAFHKSIVAQYPELSGQPFTKTKVKRIVDGDTFVTSEGDKVRLIGVNTPETHGKVQYYGQEAKEYTDNHLTGSTVYMFQDAGNTDKYGRLLRYIFIEDDNEMFNERLIREGYANTMTIPPNVLYSKTFTALERDARNNNRGLWQSSKSKSSSGQQSKSKETVSTADDKKVENSSQSGNKNAKGTDSLSSSNQGTCQTPTIKGNINKNKDKIYHLPDGRYYEQTKAEMMFCTVEDAEAAGFRASSN